MENGYRDPTADELVQRFRLTSTSSLSAVQTQRPPLTVFKRGSSVIRSVDVQSVAAYSLSRNCVSSLHQNQRTSLLYGKNNVSVTTHDGSETLKGYLSLHRESQRTITLKWMPNQLMHSNSQTTTSESPTKSDGGKLWRNTMMLNINDIIYIHLHSHGPNNPVSLVFVDTEGVQHPPFQFPPGQHCVQFLACLESELSPDRLDPPLWSEPGKGKALPQVKRKASIFRRPSDSSNEEVPESHDYVFRIKRLSPMASTVKTPATVPLRNIQLHEFSNGSTRSHSNSLPSSPATTKKRASSPGVKSRAPQLTRARKLTETQISTEKDSLLDACQTVRRQILSRAFLGWLTYCRHLKTVRTHLACTINQVVIDENLYNQPVTKEFWKECRRKKDKDVQKEFYIRVYLHGIQPELRRETWPYLMQLLPWDQEVEPLKQGWRNDYDKQLKDWMVLEKEVVRRDCEQNEKARLRQSSGLDSQPPVWGKSMSSEVFLDVEVHQQKDENENLIEDFGTNLHRIEKDVDRCDRNTKFFSEQSNLDALKRVMCSYVYAHLEEGYTQGMCDIAGPLLVIFEDEAETTKYFEALMERMKVNFPHVIPESSGVDSHLNNLKTIVQVMDTELYQQFMDAERTHLFFAYRWFLLDFKREMKYDDVYRVWETIWAADHTVSSHFPIFFAFALLTYYRQILLENNMEYTDVIKFFNEMAEKHDVTALLNIAREKVKALQELVDSSSYQERLDQ